MRRLPLLQDDPPEWLVHDGLSRCPYLPGRRARLPMRLPTRPLTATEMSERLDAGDRRQGLLLYRPQCPGCQACEAIRIDVNAFVPSRSQRRAFRRGERDLEMEMGRPSVTEEKVRLYNRHKVERDLIVGGDLLDSYGYEQFLVDTCSDTIEIDYRYDGQLVGVSVSDRSADSLSAVYCYFDPGYGHLGLGTYNILKLVDLCRRLGLPWLYLGLYIEGCRTMEYKQAFLPHERRIDGEWVRFERNRPPEQAARRNGVAVAVD